MNILESLFFRRWVPFDEVNMDCPEYYRTGDKVSECRAKIIKQRPDLAQLMEEYETAQMEQNELGRFHEFSIGVRAGAQLMIEMLKEL